ncbi:MAG: methyltransferase [Deltaproteobacteria bacterium]|nr:methyltransferase [Deltaproteobacteria bacterium]
MTDRAASLRNRLNKNLARLSSWRQRDGVTCFRAYDRDIPEVPLAIDVYEGEDGLRRLQVVAFAPRHGGGAGFVAEVEALARVAGEALGADADRVYAQVRERERGGSVEADDAAASASSFFVREGAGRFLIRMGARRDPGLFLDHRTTRRLVAEACVGRSLLNLFAYTGSFSVHAALAGARRTTSVDLSASTVRWAADNLAANGLAPGDHRVVADDVFAFLEGEGDRYDVIVLDPPSVSRSRRASRDLDVQRDHALLLRRCVARLRPGGAIWFSTNLRTFSLAPLPASLVVEEVTATTVPPDFHERPHRCFRIVPRG